MVRRGVIRRMFPGGNTSRGFTSYYEFIAPPETSYTFVLKGGPGTGKSTFMKRIAAELLALGVDTEYHHCSADPNSVDAVTFPALGVALVDGTAPHVIEPTDYEVSGEIVDLGTFCNKEPIRRQRTRIQGLRRDARLAFARTYKYLEAARHVRNDWAEVNKHGRDEARLGQETLRLLDAIFPSSMPENLVPKEPSDGAPGIAPKIAPGIAPRITPGIELWPPGSQRRLFAGSITPEGPRHHVDTLLPPMQRRFVVLGEPGTGTPSVLQAVVDQAVARGYTVEQYHCPFDPNDVEHVLIPTLGTAVVSWGLLFPYVPDSSDVVFDLGPAAGPDSATDRDLSTDGSPSEAIAIARQTFWQLLRIAIRALRDAKAAHMTLEDCYVPHVDFDGLEDLRRHIRDRILALHRPTVAFDSL